MERYKTIISKLLSVAFLIVYTFVNFTTVSGEISYSLIEPKFEGKAVCAGTDIFVFNTDIGKFRLIDVKNQKVIVADKYEEINWDFSKELIKVKVSGKYGFVDKKTGREVVKPKYDYVEDFNDLFEGLAKVKIEGKWGLIDKITGKEVLATKYDEIGTTYYPAEGLAEIKIGGKKGLVNRWGKEVVKPICDDISGFGEGLISVNIGGLWGFIDEKSGKIVIKPQYNCAGFFSEGVAPVIIGKRLYFINKSGKIVIKLPWEYPWLRFVDGFKEGLAAFGLGAHYTQWGFIDRTGKEVIKPNYDDVRSFEQGLAAVKKGNKWGFIDKTGKEIIKPKYDDIQSFKEGLAPVRMESGYGFIDKSGEELADMKFDWDYMDYMGGYFILYKDGKFGLLKTNKKSIQ